MTAIRSLVAGLLIGLACTVVGGQVSAPATITINDEGLLQGRARAINFVGAGVITTVVAGQAVVTVAGGAGTFAVTETEIDFGAAACGGAEAIGDANAPDHCEATITDASVTALSKIIAVQAGAAATSRDQDENDMDQIQCWANPAAGTFTLFCRGIDGGPVHGKFKVWYTFA